MALLKYIMITDIPNLEHVPFYICIMIIQILMIMIINNNNTFYVAWPGAVTVKPITLRD